MIGRYVFTPEIFDALDRIEPGRGGELQLTDAIDLLNQDQTVYGQVFSDGRFDIGQKVDFLRANVELALDREDLAPDLDQVLAGHPAPARHHLTHGPAAGWDGSEMTVESLEVVQARIRATVPHPHATVVPLREALGLVLAADVIAGEPVPPFANTAMDGYAVRAADTAGRAGADRCASSATSPPGTRPPRPSGRARRSGS